MLLSNSHEGSSRSGTREQMEQLLGTLRNAINR